MNRLNKILKGLQLFFGLVAVALLMFAVSKNGWAETTENSVSRDGNLRSISLDEFAKDIDYIEKMVPGSDDANSSDYWARPSFYNSDAGKAKFVTNKSEEINIYDGEVGYACDIVGVKNYLVDFTGVELTKIDRSGRTNIGATYEGGSAGVVDRNALEMRTRAQKAAMLQNTLYLQLVEYCAPSSKTITIPKGEFYFAVGHNEVEPYVIRPVNNVNISGRGIGDYKSAIDSAIKSDDASVIDRAKMTTNGSNATILKPYTSAAYDGAAAPDMFFYNDYSASGFTDSKYLSNIKYYNFVIDGEDAVGYSYTSAGKGFMYNLFDNITWNSIVVMNTDGTGFGVDSPRGATISNCLAYNNGKKATPNDGTKGEYPGASGFGIGTGYGDNENLVIKHSVAYGNAKFGFFFEHQNRFQSPTRDNYPYDAVRGGGYSLIDSGSSNSFNKTAFSVNDSLGVSNYYNYGGMRAYDMKVSDSASVAGCTGEQFSGTYYNKVTCTNSNVFYSGDTRRVKIDVDVNTVFSDVNDSSEWYYDAVKWAVEKGIIYGVSGNKFGVKEQMYRRDALVIIWRMMGYPGDVVTKRNNNQSITSSRQQDIKTCFADVPGYEEYAGAVRWAYYDRTPKIITGSVACSSDDVKDGMFAPSVIVKRAEFVTMLWRLAGEPNASGENEFVDVDENAYYYKAALWASQNGITKGVGDYKFAPDDDCTREQVVTFLYRYYQKYGI